VSTTTLERKTATAALQFSNFSYRYARGGALALDDVSLEVRPGEFLLLCGRSGSGKSTLLRAVSGLVPHHFGGEAAGEVSICGRDLRQSGAGELAAVCGTLLQDPESQSVMDGVRAEIAFPLENLGWAADQVTEAVAETANRLGIDHLLSRRTDGLSGGELQRVVLAAALSSRPRVLVLDEPTSQLDPDATEELFSLLRDLCDGCGTTILLAEHRIEHALNNVDRVVQLERGRVTVDTDPMDCSEIVAGDAALQPPRARSLSVSSAPLGGAPVLRLADIKHSYSADAEPALSGVDLTLRAGERAVLVGDNGSGKSTLLRIAHGVQRARAGSVERGGEVALLLQNPNDYLIHERVAEEAPATALARFGLEEMGECDPRDLSGGERQRLALAIVMQEDPAVLLLDEPTRGMDELRKAELAAMLEEIAERGTAVLVATHDAHFAARFAERTVRLAGGRIVSDDQEDCS
jgi:energy-coupling factor transport system ATP-binding protein